MTHRCHGHVGAIITLQHSHCNMSYVSSMKQKRMTLALCRAEPDSHADTYAVNYTTYIIKYFGKVPEVSGFAPSSCAFQNIPIVLVTLAYDNPDSGETLILVFNQTLYFDDQLLYHTKPKPVAHARKNSQ
jgi:hypothetical protein